MAMFMFLSPDCFGLTFSSLEQSEKRCGILTFYSYMHFNINADIDLKSENLVSMRDLNIEKRKPVQGDKNRAYKGFILVE